MFPQTKIIIVTLAGLYAVNIPPSSTEIAMGYTTSFTPNLAAWPILAEQYNKRLKELAAKRKVAVCDLEAYAQTNFAPRSKYFVDSVHPSPLGNLRIAELLKRSIEIELTKPSPGPFRE
jgi:lysophospholipase L1-like esterase